MSKAGVYIISGPSGSGKDTILKGVFKKWPDIYFSISSITRPMRTGEVEGDKYHFISQKEFEDLLKNDMMLEHNVFLGNYYGTPKKPIVDAVNSGKDAIIEVDVNGAAQIRKKMPECVSVFIMPPSLEVLKDRLTKRGTESDELIDKRINEALREIKCAEDYDYIIVNDTIEQATDDFVSIIRSCRLKNENQKHMINSVLGK